MAGSGAVSPSTKAGDFEVAQRIATSRTFERTERLRAFLLFVVERALNDRESELTEQSIGVQVFGRPENYNPGEDSIVRSHARLLRQRLQTYYETEGVAEERRITIPKGAYVPHFEWIGGGDGPGAVVADTSGMQIVMSTAPAAVVADVVRPGTVSRRWFALGLFAAAVAGGVITYLGMPRTPGAPGHPFWSLMFEAGRPTLFVAGDTGLVMTGNLLDRPIALNDYISRTYGRNLGESRGVPGPIIEELSQRRYTGVIDLQFLARLQTFAPASPNFRVRFARDVQMQDLKESNVLISGAHEANPWSELYRSKTNFIVERAPGTKHLRVQNRSPRAGESALYQADIDRNAPRVFGHVAYLPDSGTNGRLLIVEGTGSAGTEAAVDFLLSNGPFPKFLERIRRNGQIPGFELLVLADSVHDGKAPTATLLTERVY